MAGLNSFYISSVLITARTWGDWINTNGQQSSQAAMKYIQACEKGQMRTTETPPNPLSSVVTQEHNRSLTCLMGFVRLTTQTECGCKWDSEGMRSAAFWNWNSRKKSTVCFWWPYLHSFCISNFMWLQSQCLFFTVTEDTLVQQDVIRAERRQKKQKKKL